MQQDSSRNLGHRSAYAGLLLALGVAAAVSSPAGASITGDYVEARTSDVYTGPCFANGEMNLAGKEAILAWRVESGEWNGVALDGLGIVAVLRGDRTLGDPYADPRPVHSVLVVDDTADELQRSALVALAREMSDELLAHVVEVETASLSFEIGESGAASVTAGEVAALRTRALNHHDHLCGNEEIYYPPLVGIEGAMPAVTLEHEWSGSGLGTTWKSPGKRSAFVGSFSLR